MIRSVFVVSKSGESLYSQSFGEDNDEDVTMALSGLVSAVHSFGQMLSGNEVNEIKLGKICLVLHQREELIFALAVDVDKHQKENEAKVIPITGLFLLHFGGIIKKMSNFEDVTIFERFTQTLHTSGYLS